MLFLFLYFYFPLPSPSPVWRSPCFSYSLFFHFHFSYLLSFFSFNFFEFVHFFQTVCFQFSSSFPFSTLRAHFLLFLPFSLHLLVSLPDMFLLSFASNSQRVYSLLTFTSFLQFSVPRNTIDLIPLHNLPSRSLLLPITKTKKTEKTKTFECQVSYRLLMPLFSDTQRNRILRERGGQVGQRARFGKRWGETRLF